MKPEIIKLYQFQMLLFVFPNNHNGTFFGPLQHINKGKEQAEQQ